MMLGIIFLPFVVIGLHLPFQFIVVFLILLVVLFGAGLPIPWRCLIMRTATGPKAVQAGSGAMFGLPKIRLELNDEAEEEPLFEALTTMVANLQQSLQLPVETHAPEPVGPA